MGERAWSRAASRARAGRRSAAAVLAAAVGLLAATAAPAQEPPPAAPAAAAASERAAGPVDEFERGTPRSAVHHYLVACRAGDFERAARYLDLASLPEGKPARRGVTLARQLKAVLDRKLWVETDRLSDAPEGYVDDGLPEGRDLVGYVESESGPVEILVDRVPRDDGVRIWKFASPTVRQIASLYDELGYGRLGEWLPPVFFERHFLEIQLWQWLGLLALVVIVYLVSWLLARGFIAATAPAVSRSTTDIDDRVLSAVVGPLRLLFGALLFYAGLQLLALSVPAEAFFTNATKVASLLAATWLVLRLIDVFAELAESRLMSRGDRGSTALVPLGRKTVKVVVVALALLASLDSFGFDVTALIAGLGVGGLAVALAAQKTIENLFGGATLIADRPVEVGDFCRFGEKIGTVEQIGMRSTRVRTLDRTVVTIPNAEFSALQLENFGKRDMIKYSPRLGLLYATTTDQLRYVLVEIRRMLYSHPRVLSDPARVRFVGFGASSLDIEIFSYVDATDWGEYLGVVEDLNLRIMDIVEASGTGFAFPSTTAYLAQDTGTDAEKTERAEAAVRDWAEQQELFLPGFPDDRIEALKETLPYPPPGAPPGVRK